jgi:hypothetical protein
MIVQKENSFSFRRFLYYIQLELNSLLSQRIAPNQSLQFHETANLLVRLLSIPGEVFETLLSIQPQLPNEIKLLLLFYFL